MRRKEGFTLVELLVVMAIIAILAAIAVPNVQRYIQRSRATQAMTEIANIETAITKILSDAGRSSLNDLIDHGAVRSVFGGADIGTWTAAQFEDAVELYSNAMYVLLRRGREAANIPEGGIFKKDVIRTLGLDYFTDLGTDPWGKLYQFFPGPWSPRFDLIVFRSYLPKPGTGIPGDDTDVPDALTLVDGANGVSFVEDDLIDLATTNDGIGYPANDREAVYVWSFGANGITGQAQFTPGAYNAAPNPGSLANYTGEQEPEFMGGGDDINNWDRAQTFMRFYN